MKGLDFNHSPGAYMEITPATLHAVGGGAGLDLPLERGPDGRLTQASRERAAAALQNLGGSGSWQGRTAAYCAIPARGISIRRLVLPPVPKEELPRVLQLQIEGEFPLTPAELAWGYKPIDSKEARKGEVLVVAARKEVVDEYTALFNQAGFNPVFIPAPLARAGLCPAAGAACGLLNIGETTTEAGTIAGGLPKPLRSLPWGESHLVGAVQDALSLGRAEAQQACQEWYTDSVAGTARGAKIEEAASAAIKPLVEALGTAWTGQTVYITGKPAGGRGFANLLALALGKGVQCERIEPDSRPGHSAAVRGMQAIVSKSGPQAFLAIQSKPGAALARNPSKFAPTRRAALVACLLVGCLAFPYVEAAVMKPIVARRLLSVQSKKQRLRTIDRELDFLQYVKDNQPPYLEAIYLFANAAQNGGWKMDNVGMNRRGEVSLGGTVRDPQQIGNFRTKLIESGFFSSVVVEEQTPSPDRQKITVRMSAQWKDASARELLNLGPASPDASKPGGGSNAPTGTLPKDGSTNAPAKMGPTNITSTETNHGETKR